MMDYKLDLPEGFEELILLGTLISPADSTMGIIIMGEDYAEEAEQPTVWVYLVRLDAGKWHIADELEAFTFLNFESAKRFVVDLPTMSAIDLLLLMNGRASSTLNGSFVQ